MYMAFGLGIRMILKELLNYLCINQCQKVLKNSSWLLTIYILNVNKSSNILFSLKKFHLSTTLSYHVLIVFSVIWAIAITIE
jgi:hypothetical protein